MKKQTFIFSSVILIISVAAAKLTGALFRIPLANMLGGTGMGYFSGAYGIFMTIYALSVTGLPTAVAKLIAENSELKNYANIRRIKSVAIGFFGVTGGIFSALLILIAYPFCVFTNGVDSIPSVLMIAPSIFFGCITAVYRGYYEGLRNMFPTAISQIVEGIFKLAAGLALCIYVIHNPESFIMIRRLFGGCSNTAIAAAAAVLGITLSTIAGTVFLIARDKLKGDGIKQEKINSCSGQIDQNNKIIKKLLETAIPVAAGALVTNLTSLIDLITITRALGKAVRENPLYFSEISATIVLTDVPNFLFGSFTGLAVTVFNLVPSFTNMFGKGILPSLSEAFTSGRKALIKVNTERAILLTGIVAFPSGLGICALSEQILEFLFPAKAVEASLCTLSLSFLGIAVIFLCISSTIFSILQAAGKPHLPVRIMLIGVLVKLAGNLFLVSVPQLNITGAAISTLLCYAIMLIPSVFYLIRLTEIESKVIFTFFVKLLYCSAMCALSARLAVDFLCYIVNTPFVLFYGIFIGVIIYIFFGFILGIFTKSTLKLLIS